MQIGCLDRAPLSHEPNLQGGNTAFSALWVETVLGAGEGRLTHIYCQWEADLDLGCGLKVPGVSGQSFFFGILAGLNNGIYSIYSFKRIPDSMGTPPSPILASGSSALDRRVSYSEVFAVPAFSPLFVSLAATLGLGISGACREALSKHCLVPGAPGPASYSTTHQMRKESSWQQESQFLLSWRFSIWGKGF